MYKVLIINALYISTFTFVAEAGHYPPPTNKLIISTLYSKQKGRCTHTETYQYLVENSKIW
jgi:hypothetical protein